MNNLLYHSTVLRPGSKVIALEHSQNITVFGCPLLFPKKTSRTITQTLSYYQILKDEASSNPNLTNILEMTSALSVTVQ